MPLMILNIAQNSIRRRKRIKYLVTSITIVLLYILYSCTGIRDCIIEEDFENFNYSLCIDIKPVVNEILSGKNPSVNPINYYPYRFLTNSNKCRVPEKINLFIVVKSAMQNFDARMAIRQTYGRENITRDVIKMLFFVGTEERESRIQRGIEDEVFKYKDIVQMDFLDSYFNNTIKTMMSFRWLFEHCSEAEFYLFTDDDMYVSVSNLLEYIETSTSDGWPITPKYLFYAGHMFKSKPHRIIGRKRRVSVEEYPWNDWPPYVTAGAYVVSNQAMKVMYVASLFVKHFRFDDIYLGIVAKKAGVVPTHCDRFHFYKKLYSKKGYRDVIASHGYGDRDELVSVWNEQHTDNSHDYSV